MTIFNFVFGMFSDAITHDAPQRMTIKDAETDLANFRADGWTLPDGMTPAAYADHWNYFTDRHYHGNAYEEKARGMRDALTLINRLMRQQRPDKKIDCVYSRESFLTLDSFTPWQQQYFGIRANEEYITVWDEETGCLLYCLNVTADSVLTAISELMDLLARKF